MTEGPYYFDADAIREDREGVALTLAIRVRDADCRPLPNAVVDIWHCEAGGSYSGFDSAGGARGGGPTDAERFLRGAQVTNQDGIVEFTTIYPGWHRGRTVHIHAKVHLDRTSVLTTQLFSDDDVSAAVYEREPYAGRTGRDVFNDGDGIFDEALVLDLPGTATGTPARSRSMSQPRDYRVRVDDEPNIVDVVTMALRFQGFAVESAGTAPRRSPRSPASGPT